MRFSVEKSCIICLFLLICSLTLYHGQKAYGQTHPVALQKVDNAAPTGIAQTIGTPPDPSGSSASDNDAKFKQAGEQVGQQIDRFTQFAAAHFGDWIKATVFAGITWLKLIITLFLLFLVLLFERIVRLVITRQKKKIAAQKEDKSIWHIGLEAAATPLSLFILVYGTYIVMIPLFVHFRQPDGTNLIYVIARKAADLGAAVALVWFIFKMVSIVDFHLKNWADSTGNTIDNILAPLVGKTLRVFIVIIGGILIIQNLTGVQIGPLLASLGIGGIAVALAAKDTIANFFGTLTILFDKPFQVGERILIDSYDGVVEDVGFRSTRIRTLTGHLVTIPNEKLVNTGLENISKRPHIRWLTNITVTYDTPPEKVEKAVSILRQILDNHEGMHPDFPPRVYFNGFNDWSLNIMMIAWFHPADYWVMQEWQQRTCLQILNRFNEEGIDFAFPSRTVYLANDDHRQLKLEMLKGETAAYMPHGERDE